MKHFKHQLESSNKKPHKTTNIISRICNVSNDLLNDDKDIKNKGTESNNRIITSNHHHNALYQTLYLFSQHCSGSLAMQLRSAKHRRLFVNKMCAHV